MKQFLIPQTQTQFLTLTSCCDKCTCNSLAPAMYLLGDSWYQFTLQPIETLSLVVLKSMIKLNLEKYQLWIIYHERYIYSDNDLETLRDHIIFLVERLSVLNIIARGMMEGQPGFVNGG